MPGRSLPLLAGEYISGGRQSGIAALWKIVHHRRYEPGIAILGVHVGGKLFLSVEPGESFVLVEVLFIVCGD